MRRNRASSKMMMDGNENLFEREVEDSYGP